MNRTAFFASLRSSGAFGGTLSQSFVDGCETILAASETVDLRMRAYLLATAYHETAHTMLPVRETLASTDDEAISRLERAWAKGQLKWVTAPYWRKDPNGKAWFGRGYVQLTHERNYRAIGDRLNVDLVANPHAALNPTVAAKVLAVGCVEGIFTGRRLADYINENTDYINARRVVNGTDRAETIAGYAMAFQTALEAAQARTGDEPAPTPTPKPSGALAAFIQAFIEFLFGSKK